MMASWSHWLWVTTTAFIIEWLVGCAVTANSLLIVPVQADQMSLQMKNFPEVWRQARGGFPVTIPIKRHRLVEDPSLLEDKVIKQDHEPSLVESHITKRAHGHSLVEGEVSKLVHELSLVKSKVTRIPVHDQPFIKNNITIPIHGHSLVQDNATFSIVDKKVLPVRKGIIGKGEIVNRVGGIPEKVDNKQLDMGKGAPPIKAMEDNVVEDHKTLTNQEYESFDKLNNNDQHKTSEVSKKVTIEDANPSVNQSVSRISVELGSNGTIIMRHHKYKFPRVESWSVSQVTSAESNGNMQQNSQGIYTRQNTPKQFRVKKVEPHIGTRNKSGSDLHTDIIINKRKFGNIDIDTTVNEKEVIGNEHLGKMGTEGDTNSTYGDELNEYQSNENVTEKLYETLEDVYSFNPIEMQPTEPSIEEEMTKFIRIFRSEKKDSNKTKNGNKSKEAINNNTKQDKEQPNIPEVERVLIDDNSTFDKQLSDQDLAKLSSLAHVATGGLDENLQRKLEVSAEDTNLNSSRAGKAISRRPVLIQVKPEDISIIFSKRFLQERRSPYQANDLKDQKVSSRELHSENLERRRKHLKTIIKNNESSVLNAFSLNGTYVRILKEGQADDFISTILPSVLKNNNTYWQEKELPSENATGKDVESRHLRIEEETRSDLQFNVPDTLAMTRKDQGIVTHQGANNDDINTQEDKELSDDLIASASIIDFASPSDNQSMERSHIRIEFEGRAVRAKFMDITNIVAVTLGTLVFIIIVIVISAAVLYRRLFLMKPHTLDECYTNSESGSSCCTVQDIFQTVSYEDCQGIDLPRDNSDEMFNLDNDSFLNSLEAMTIPEEHWNDGTRK